MIRRPYKRLLLTCLIIITSAGFCLGSPNASDLLKKKSFVWKTIESEHLRIHFEPTNLWAENHIGDLQQYQEKAISKNLKLLKDNDFPFKVDLFAVASKERMKQLIGTEDNGTAFGDTRILCFIYNEKLYYWGSHELMHIMATDAWGGNYQKWINEGLATYSEKYWFKYKLDDFNKYLLEKNKHIPLEKLISNFGKFSGSISYPQAGSFVKFIIEKYGSGKLKEIWNQGKVKDIERILGKNIETLEGEWIAKIMEADASKVKEDSLIKN